jgi:hypothetical protein
MSALRASQRINITSLLPVFQPYGLYRIYEYPFHLPKCQLNGLQKLYIWLSGYRNISPSGFTGSMNIPFIYRNVSLTGFKSYMYGSLVTEMSALPPALSLKHYLFKP